MVELVRTLGHTIVVLIELGIIGALLWFGLFLLLEAGKYLNKEYSDENHSD